MSLQPSFYVGPILYVRGEPNLYDELEDIDDEEIHGDLFSTDDYSTLTIDGDEWQIYHLNTYEFDWDTDDIKVLDIAEDLVDSRHRITDHPSGVYTHILRIYGEDNVKVITGIAVFYS